MRLPKQLTITWQQPPCGPSTCYLFDLKPPGMNYWSVRASNWQQKCDSSGRGDHRSNRRGYSASCVCAEARTLPKARRRDIAHRTHVVARDISGLWGRRLMGSNRSALAALGVAAIQQAYAHERMSMTGGVGLTRSHLACCERESASEGCAVVCGNGPIWVFRTPHSRCKYSGKPDPHGVPSCVEKLGSQHAGRGFGLWCGASTAAGRKWETQQSDGRKRGNCRTAPVPRPVRPATTARAVQQRARTESS